MDQYAMLQPITFGTMILAFVVGVTVHELSHALAATWSGDPTPRATGRLTVNPLAHLDLVGLLLLVTCGVGWARPVLFNPRNFAYPRLQTLLTAFAGPVSNLAAAAATLLIVRYMPDAWATAPVLSFAHAMLSINVMLAVFNLLPIPPLDGGHLVSVICADLAPALGRWVQQYSPLFLIILVLLPGFRLWLTHLIKGVEVFLVQNVMQF